MTTRITCTGEPSCSLSIEKLSDSRGRFFTSRSSLHLSDATIDITYNMNSDSFMKLPLLSSLKIPSLSMPVAPESFALSTAGCSHQPAKTLGKRSFDDTRLHKIRIVEKLGCVKSALSEESDASSFISPDGEFSTIDWLDDTSLNQLSTQDLEKLTDKYIEAVMRDLVQVASADEDLQYTFNSLDTLGFNLLHYCCMYKLNNLIPALVSKGASVNQATTFGSTALHLACGVGNVEAAQLLLASGADPALLDAAGALPVAVAVSSGHACMQSLFPALACA